MWKSFNRATSEVDLSAGNSSPIPPQADSVTSSPRPNSLPAVTVLTSPPNAPQSPGSPSAWSRSSRKGKKKSSRTILKSQTTKTDYQLGEKIGKGADGLVRTALNLDTGEVVAVKTLKYAASVQTELTLLKKLVHTNIVNYVDSIRDGDHLHIGSFAKLGFTCTFKM